MRRRELPALGWKDSIMRPSVALQKNLVAVRRAAQRFKVANMRVFGSVIGDGQSSGLAARLAHHRALPGELDVTVAELKAELLAQSC